MKHRVALNLHVRKQEKVSSQGQGEHTPCLDTTLLPLPEIPSDSPIGLDNESSDMFKNFRRLGLNYLDESGEQLEFSAGTVSDSNEGQQSQTEETMVTESDFSDSESDNASVQPEQTTRDGRLRDYWPYPSKTVSDKL